MVTTKKDQKDLLAGNRLADHLLLCANKNKLTFCSWKVWTFFEMHQFEPSIDYCGIA